MEGCHYCCGLTTPLQLCRTHVKLISVKINGNSKRNTTTSAVALWIFALTSEAHVSIQWLVLVEGRDHVLGTECLRWKL